MPLTFDMTRDELAAYEGTNPRPEDFDRFWDASLRELDSLDSQLEIETAAFQTEAFECSHLWFRGTGGARVHAKLVRPRLQTEPQPAVLMFHGYAQRSADWSELLGYASLGYTVAAMDCRGQAGLSEDVGGVTGWTLEGHIVRGLQGPPKQLYYRQVFLDTALLARLVMGMDHVDESRVGVTGPSQGGALTIACAALEPRIKLAAPVFPFLCDYQRVWGLDLDAYKEVDDWFRRFDPRHEREGEIFTQLGYIDIQFLAPRIRADVLLGVGLADRTCPPSSQFAVYNKIASPKSVILYPDFRHELPLADHADAVFAFLAQL
ncbi:acetylxylan esterase [Phycicoccus sp. Soil802]|uniref:acetylxylan esterase n=1 Tax=Phycicoccus sp. Soil802 TaxID=1736414 RepID=UPI000702EBEF|nr:acetylxylan esterase [Phycicoccus sp. Soil802]KRF27840.1 acetyl esterase [Phycicoccus sp. Soil802]